MKKIIIGLINFYKKNISPLKRYPSCRFFPTCSTYAIMAIEKYGVIKGGLKALWRLIRCNPFSKGGVDLP